MIIKPYNRKIKRGKLYPNNSIPSQVQWNLHKTVILFVALSLEFELASTIFKYAIATGVKYKRNIMLLIILFGKVVSAKMKSAVVIGLLHIPYHYVSPRAS